MIDIQLTTDKNVLQTELLNVKNRLNDSDYKVIKCAEALALNIELPYDIEELHSQRQQWRDLINQIEERLEELNVEDNDYSENLYSEAVTRKPEDFEAVKV